MPASLPETVPIPAVHADDVDVAAFEREHVQPGRPVVLREAMEGWPALQRWQDPEYLAQAAGERAVLASDQSTGAWSQIPLKQLWRNVFARDDSPYSYIHAAMVEKGRPGVLGNLDPDTALGPLLPADRHVATMVSAGHDSRSGFHYHPDTEALLFQVVGTKRALLFPPEDWSRVYPADWYSPYVSFSKAAFGRQGEWPDLGDFPRLARTHPMECVVEPGDVLYIPIYWWHVIWGLGTAICATQFFRSSFRKRYLTLTGLRSNGLNRVGGLRLRLNKLRLRLQN
jgi:ribosomal protein L16 Arg81 hydroxylase